VNRTGEGRDLATFTEVEEITSEIEPVEAMQNDPRGGTIRPAGKQKPPKVILRRPFTAGMEIWTWHAQVLKGAMATARKSAVLTMFNANNKAIATYHLENAWPSKIEIGAQKDDGSGPLSETVTLICDELRRIAP
jgi:phage tail-like protein